MKRLPTIVLALILILASDYGTSPAQGRTEWGLKFGLDFDKHIYTGGSSASHNSVNNRIGLAIGVFLTRYISDRVAFQPEFYYAIRGFTKKYLYEYGVGYSSYEQKVRMDCLEMPLLWKFLLGSGRPQLNLIMGPDFAVFLHTRSESHYDDYWNGEHHSSSVSHSGSNGWDRWGDVGLIVGGGLDFVVGKGKILFDTRCNLGLTRILFFLAERTIEPMISLRVGYAF